MKRDENISDGGGNTVVGHSAGYSEALAKAMAENNWHHEEADDYTWDNSQIIQIVLNGNEITVNGTGVMVSGSKATITSAGNYDISGSLTNGQIIVNTENQEVVRLILNGVNISNSTSAPINIQAAKKVVIVLASGTENSVIDGASYIFENPNEDEPNAAIFSKADLTIYGSGSLTVKGNYNDAIASKDGLIIAGGSENITSVDDGRPKKAITNVSVNVTAKDDGIRGKDYLVIRDAEISVKAGGDGLKSDNADDATRGYIWIRSGGINIASGKDAITAETDALISDGTFTLTCGGGSNCTVPSGTSAKGIKGLVGLFIATGPNSGPMIEVPSTSSTQYSVYIALSGGLSPSSLFHIQDASGNDMVTFKPVRNFYYIVFSSPNLTRGSTYSIYTGGSSTGTNTNGLYVGGTYSGGTMRKSFTISSIVTKVNI